MKKIRIGDRLLPIKDYYCTDGKDVLPREDGKLWLYVNLTDVCNAFCPFCINPGRKTGESPFDPERFKEVLTGIREHVSGVSLTGGEPMLDPALIDSAIDAVNEVFASGSIEIDLVTNGYGFSGITSLRNLKYLDSVHLSRHRIADEDNDRLFCFESVRAEEAAKVIERMEDPGKIVLNCLLMEGGIDSAEEAALYMDLAVSMGVRNVSFIGMSRCNAFCEAHYVDPEELHLENVPRFMIWSRQKDSSYCSCASGVFRGRYGNTRFYCRSVGAGMAPYVRQLVYTADNRLLAGFNGEEIRFDGLIRNDEEMRYAYPAGERLNIGRPAPKKYKTGMYGGKFLPFHKGHRYCVEVAASECEKVYVILFYGGADEERILKETPDRYLSVEERAAQMYRICEDCRGEAEVIPALIDTSNLKLPDGSDDWEAETPLVRALVGDRLDAVYSSEESYGEYFKRAYPEAEHRLVDVKRIRYPISGTMIREMDTEEERQEWMV